MSQLSGNMIVFHVDQALLELFQFTHGKLFGTPCRDTFFAFNHILIQF